ncbi:NUDIX domain-containing protein [Streptosporangium sp. NBC_01810]|uniref:NUDIX domain-containing protein n=1 Tax=Streptosporangium sp. NBC_01810 TaxID=2975951 RepID=UPI002DDC3273|nr:NUDIX domain-containing protein [Streptosporangium sp. NBC_01810]WSA26841.1 NUDIX domain-containing protein [Streptosporangium sp. NBC_01810]
MTDLQHLVDDADRDGIQKLVVGAVVYHDDRVLILRRSSGDDFLPGIEELPSGGVDDGEDLRSALARELAEEIGWSGPLILDRDFVAVFDYLSGSGRKARQCTVALSGNACPIVLSDEHESYRWITLDELSDSDLTDETVQAIHDWAATRR